MVGEINMSGLGQQCFGTHATEFSTWQSLGMGIQSGPSSIESEHEATFVGTQDVLRGGGWDTVFVLNQKDIECALLHKPQLTWRAKIDRQVAGRFRQHPE